MYANRWSRSTLVVGLWLGTHLCAGQEMTAHYIDVGQGDATLLEFPCGAILIDAGAQSRWYGGRLMTYLRDFFDRRTDLEGTLESVIVTHPHIDHNRGLRRVLQEFEVKRYIDNGWTEGSGGSEALWVRQEIEAGNLDTRLIEITDDAVTSLPHRNGLTSEDIDPIHCSECDPHVRILASRLLEDPGWPSGEFDDENNHSLAIRVDFGQSSFLFTGDLKEPAIETMVDWYSTGDMLDVDVYQVGHHGSHNGTTESLMTAMTADIAVISCGKYRSRGLWTAYSFGHPRKLIITLLESHLTGTRPLQTVKVATGMRRFEDHSLSKAVCATAWDRTVKIRGRLNGEPVLALEP